jgi:hypothetical protein
MCQIPDQFEEFEAVLESGSSLKWSSNSDGELADVAIDLLRRAS